jgi:hypothetical protein
MSSKRWFGLSHACIKREWPPEYRGRSWQVLGNDTKARRGDASATIRDAKQSGVGSDRRTGENLVGPAERL